MTPEDREWLTKVHEAGSANTEAITRMNEAVQLLGEQGRQLRSTLADTVMRARLSTLIASVLFSHIARETGGGRRLLDEMLADLEGSSLQLLERGEIAGELRVQITAIINEIVELAEQLNVERPGGSK